MNDRISDKWDIVKWCGKIIKKAFGMSKWHFFCNICYGCSVIRIFCYTFHKVGNGKNGGIDERSFFTWSCNFLLEAHEVVIVSVLLWIFFLRQKTWRV